MGLFATHRAIKRLQERLDDQMERLHTLESAHKRLGLEWEELYDKVRHQMSRMARRAAVDATLDADLPEGMDAPTGVVGTDPISQKILARRGIPRQAE